MIVIKHASIHESSLCIRAAWPRLPSLVIIKHATIHESSLSILPSLAGADVVASVRYNLAVRVSDTWERIACGVINGARQRNGGDRSEISRDRPSAAPYERGPSANDVTPTNEAIVRRMRGALAERYARWDPSGPPHEPSGTPSLSARVRAPACGTLWDPPSGTLRDPASLSARVRAPTCGQDRRGGSAQRDGEQRPTRQHDGGGGVCTGAFTLTLT